MARAFTTDQKALLREASLRATLLIDMYLDEGTFRFCDDVINYSDGTNTYIGANPLIDGIEYKSGMNLSAEPVIIKCDANRMEQAGIDDPMSVLREMMDYLHKQRRVDWSVGFSKFNTDVVELKIPIYAGKINYVRLTDPELTLSTGDPVQGQLEIALDALSLRYQRATHRTRSNEDQRRYHSDDKFFDFVASASRGEINLLWGK